MNNPGVFQHNVYIGAKHVPNEGSPGAPIWIIGDAPGEHEEESGRPFTGPAGELLRTTLQESGFSTAPSDIYFANLCQYRPYANKFELLEHSQQLAAGKEQLTNDIRKHKPVLIIALGDKPMEYLVGVTGIYKRRGTVEFSTLSSCTEVKVISTYHPGYILRNSSAYPTFSIDLARAYKESTTREIKRVAREYHINPQGTELYLLHSDYKNQSKLACDIETVKVNKKGEGGDLLCIGFAKSPLHAVSFNSEDPEQFKLAIDLLEDENIEKIFHFGNGFDIPYFFARYQIEVRNYKHDTYIAQSILNPELPKRLDFLVSTYTDEPSYKTEGRGEIPTDTKVWGKKTNKANLYIYNCKDCAYTFEVHEQQLKELSAHSLTSLYEQVMQQTEMAFHISHNGLLVDADRRDLMRRSCLYAWAVLQFITDSMVSNLSGGAIKKINVRSTPAKRKLLYEIFKLPKRYNKGKLATDEDALVSLMTHCEDKIANLKTQVAINEWRVKQQIIRNILGITEIRQLLSVYILARLSPDGRIRSIYNCAGPESGRWAATKYIDGTGVNSQTFPRGGVKIFETDGTSPIDLNVLLAEISDNESEQEELEV